MSRLAAVFVRPIHFLQRDLAMESRTNEKKVRFRFEKLEERIAPSNANFPPGQFPSGNPAHAPGRSNPNEVPATNPSND